MSDEYIIEIIEESAPTIEIVNTEKISVLDLPDYYPVAQISGLADYLNSFIVNGSGLNKVYYSNSGIVLSVTGVTGGSSLEDIQDAIGSYISGYSGINVSYNDSTGYTSIFLSGLNSTYISDFDNKVSGLLPSIVGSGYSIVSFLNNQYIVSTSGLQPSGNYSVSGHNHLVSDITNFNSGVSGLLPVKNIVAGPNISVSGVSGIYTIGNTMTSVETSSSVVTIVFNKTGFSIPKMTAVYINGGQGDLPTIQKALATADISSAGTYGITYEAIDNMSSGRVIVLGALTGLDTDQFNPAAPTGDVNGTVLYLSPTVSGALTTTKPYAPYHTVAMGTIVRTHQNAGVIEVRVQNGYELDELHNVAATGANSGQFLKYDGFLWRNSGIISSDIADFASAVSGISPNISISGTSGVAVNKNGNNYTVYTTGNFGLTSSQIQDLLNSGVNIYITGGSGNLSSLTILNIPVSVSGHYHTLLTDNNFEEFNIKSNNSLGMFIAKTQNSSDGSLGIEVYDTGDPPARVGYSLLGVRGSDGFLQSQSDTFRIEKEGGDLANLLVQDLISYGSGNFAQLYSSGIPVSVSGHAHNIFIGSGNNSGILIVSTDQVLNIIGSGNTSIAYDDISNTLTISSSGGGGGSSNVSISGSGNGRLFTSDGTSTNIIGNSGLTYISGTLTVFDSIKIDNKNNTINTRNITNIVNSSKLYLWNTFR